MKKLAPNIMLFVGTMFMVFAMTCSPAPAYSERGSAKTNFEPSKRSMSFIEFTNAPENHGIRDMRSLKKRYARYRGGRFPIADAGSSSSVHRGDRP